MFEDLPEYSIEDVKFIAHKVYSKWARLSRIYSINMYQNEGKFTIRYEMHSKSNIAYIRIDAEDLLICISNVCINNELNEYNTALTCKDVDIFVDKLNSVLKKFVIDNV